VVKEVLIGEDAITIRHSIPVPPGPPQNGGPPAPGRPQNLPGGQSYLLRKGCGHSRCKYNRRASIGNPVFGGVAVRPTRCEMTSTRSVSE
jgi:site-specific DNA recombinase